MTQAVETDHPPDICLLLRVHGEQRWLISKVVPVLRQLEQPGAVAADEAGAALAYLGGLWLEDRLRPTQTHATAHRLHPRRHFAPPPLSPHSNPYYAPA